MKSKATAMKAAKKSGNSRSQPKAMKAMKAKAMKAMKAKAMKSKAMKSKAMKSKAMKSSKVADPVSAMLVMKKIIDETPSPNTGTITKLVGKDDQELWSKVSVKDIPAVWVVTKQYNKEVAHEVYGQLEKKSTFKFP